MRQLFLIIVLLLNGISGSVVAQDKHDPHAGHEHSQQQTAQSVLPTEQAAIYSCPMHPHIQQPTPGTCPICGMDLVLQRRQNNSTVTVDGAMQQALAIRTATAQPRTLWRFIDTFAQVQYPEDAIHHSHIRAEGWVEQLFVRNLGQHVKAGDKLFSYYAPDLLVAQDDYLQALSVASQNGSRSSGLLARAETRLRLLGLTDSDIKQLQDSRKSQYHITVYAHQDGIVTLLNIREGMYIKPADTVLELTSISRVWLIADVPEQQIQWVREGMPAEVDIPSRQITGIETAVDYVYPALDATTRSLKVRLTLDNSKRLLQPNMLLPVRLYGGALRDVLAVPQQAVLVSASGSRVVVRRNESFSVRPITTGSRAQGYVEILSGLHDGEEVVVSGQFLLDAEASLTQLPESQAAPAHQHQE